MAETVPQDDLPQPARGAVPADDLPDEHKQSMASVAMQPIKNIPGDIASEFRGGAKEISDTYKSQRETLNKGEIPSKVSGLGYVTGGLREAMSPITGTVKALAQDPVQNAVSTVAPPHVAEFFGNLVGDAAAMFGPGAVGKSAQAISKTMPGLNGSVKMLMDSGVKLTPGQIFRSVAKKLEDTVRVVPGVGGFVRKSEIRAIEDFNKAVLNKSLADYGEKIPDNIPAGRKAIAYVDKALGKKYDDLLPKLTFKPDSQLVSDLTAATQSNARRLNDSQDRQWKAVLQHMQDNLDPVTGTMDGHTFKKIESELNYLANANAISPVPSDRMFADSINDMRAAMRDALERSNPKYGGELQQLNKAWATFARAQGASVRNVKEGGVFSPADLLREIKSSSSKGAFARGDAMLQDFAEAGNEVLPNSVPEVGFYERGMWLGLLGAGEQGALGSIVTPQLAATAGGLSALYTKPGISAVNKAVRGAPNVGTGISQSPALGMAAAESQEQGQ